MNYGDLDPLQQAIVDSVTAASSMGLLVPTNAQDNETQMVMSEIMVEVVASIWREFQAGAEPFPHSAERRVQCAVSTVVRRQRYEWNLWTELDTAHRRALSAADRLREV